MLPLRRVLGGRQQCLGGIHVGEISDRDRDLGELFSRGVPDLCGVTGQPAGGCPVDLLSSSEP